MLKKPHHITGHKNPDTDSICSALGLAHFMSGTPIKQGEINTETEFVLEYFGVEAPITQTDATGLDIVLVDHAEPSQSINNLYKAKNLHAIIDHHRVDIHTSSPLYYICKPVGCTATIITELYSKKMFGFIGINENRELSPPVAGCLLAAILSDTATFKSPTCTSLDKEMAIYLASLAKISNISEFGKKMLDAKSQFENLSDEKIFLSDYKEFIFKKKKIGISQIELADEAKIKNRIDDIQNLMRKKISSENLHLIIFVITNLEKKISTLYAEGNTEDLEKAFETKLGKKNEFTAPNLLSRKKQLVPILDKYFSKTFS